VQNGINIVAIAINIASAVSVAGVSTDAGAIDEF